MEWANDKIVKFIQPVETRPVLWDTANSDYKDKNKKHDATKELAENWTFVHTQFSTSAARTVRVRKLLTFGRWIHG